MNSPRPRFRQDYDAGFAADAISVLVRVVMIRLWWTAYHNYGKGLKQCLDLVALKDKGGVEAEKFAQSEQLDTARMLMGGQVRIRQSTVPSKVRSPRE